MTSGDRGLQSGRLSRPAPGAVAQPGYDTCVAARTTVLDPAEVPDFVMLSDISRPAGMEPHWPVSAPETESRCSVPDRWV